MKLRDIKTVIFFVYLLLLIGCQPQPADEGVMTDKGRDGSDDNIYARYGPAKIDIMPLTGVIKEKSKLNIYVGLLDAFSCRQKAPVVFRFELYQRVLRSAEPKGRRIAIWPDIDLTDPTENNKYWRDFLRAYEFNLDFEPQGSREYVLQMTCRCPDGRRLEADFILGLEE